MIALIATAYGDVENLMLAERPEPKTGPGDVKIRVHAAGINPLDWKLLSGQQRATMELHFPAILGRDASGEVLEVGDNVKSLRAGDRVLGFASSTFAERVVAPENAWAKVPGGLELTAAAALPMVALTGAQLADTIEPRSGLSILVTGAVGGVGRVAVFVAKTAGATVWAGVKAEQKAAAGALGADRIVAIDDDAEIATLPEFDAMCDTVDGETMAKLLPRLKRGGILGSTLGEAPTPDDRRPVVYYDKVAPRYFETMGTPILSGRDFADHDRTGTPPVAIVNQTFARGFWQSESAIGKRFRLSEGAAPWIEIIGVVADGKYQSLGEPAHRHVYLPSLQNFHSAMTLVLHTSGDPHGYVLSMRSLVQKLDPDLPVTDVRTMNEHLGFAMYPVRTSALLFTISGALGLLLAMIGVYGLLTFAVRQRTREVGIRLAIGARSQDVVRLVVCKSAWLLALGLGFGLVAAYATTGLMAGFLYGIDGRDVLTFVAAPIFLLLAAAIATAVPARQVSRVDAIVALRTE